MTRRAEDKYGGLKLEEMVRNRNEKSLNKIIKWKIAVFFMYIGMWLFDKEKPQLMPLLADNANITMYRDEEGYLIF